MPAQAQSIEWIRQFGNSPFGSAWAQTVAVDSGWVYVAGSISSTLGLDAYVSKYDENGTLVWTRRFGASPILFPGGFIVPSVHINGIAVDGTGIYICGDTLGPLEGQTSNGRTDAFVKKYDSDGNLLWTREFGTVSDTFGLGAAVDSAGVYIAGYVRQGAALPGQSSAGREDAFIRSYDPGGNELWTRQFGTIYDDRAKGIAAAGGGIYIAGFVQESLPGQANAGYLDSFVRKYDANGNDLWTRQFGGTGWDEADAIAVTNGGVYVSGFTLVNSSGPTEFDAYVRKYDLVGNEVWTRLVPDQDAAHALAADGAGVYVLGEHQTSILSPPFLESHAALRRYDSDGDMQWSWQFETTTSTWGNGVAADSTEVYIAGSSNSVVPPRTAYVAKLSQFPPAMNAGGVVNSASYAVSPAAVAPGSIAALFGISLNDGSTVITSSIGADGKLVTSLGGASVTINNIPAPMFYSTYGQLGVQIPFELAGETSATIQVTARGQVSAVKAINLDSFAPGIFTVNQQGTGLAAALHQDGITPLTAANPARPNEVITLFATGLGALSPPLATGARAGSHLTATTPTVSVDTIQAQVQFSGAAPGFVGLNQINVRIPPNSHAPASVPVFLSIGGRQSNSVTIPIAP